MEFKSRDANRLNAENDEHFQKQQVKIRKELQEAANEKVDIKLRCGTLFRNNFLLHAFKNTHGTLYAIRRKPIPKSQYMHTTYNIEEQSPF